MTRPIRGVAFDMDGLIFDSEPLYYEITHRMLLKRGKATTQELINAMMGRRPLEALAVLRAWHGLEETVETLFGERSGLYSTLLETYMKPMPGLFELLTALESAGIPRCVATSASRAQAEEALCRWGLTDSFAFVLAAEDVSAGKPEPEIYLSAARRLDIEPGQMLVLEDSQTGLRAAKAAGAPCVVVPHPYNAGQDFSGANEVVDSLAAPRLLALLGCTA